MIAVANIPPQRIVDAFGNYLIGIAEALVGSGHPDDGRFMDLATEWSPDTPEILASLYLKRLVAIGKQQRSNFIEFWGWPEIRYRQGDNCGMVYSRVRFMYVIAVPPGRPN